MEALPTVIFRTTEMNGGELITSGARNSGVPQKVPVLSPYPMPSLHRPKSAILTYPSVSNSKLSSFKSLQTKMDETANWQA